MTSAWKVPPKVKHTLGICVCLFISVTLMGSFHDVCLSRLDVISVE